MAQKPSDQLAALAKAAKSGELRGVVTHAVDSLRFGPSTLASLKATLVEYDAAVDNASALGAFLRQELQADPLSSNGDPAGIDVVKIAPRDVGTITDVLGNSSSSSQASADPPAPPLAQDGSPAPPQASPGAPSPGALGSAPPVAGAPVAGPGLPRQVVGKTLTTQA